MADAESEGPERSEASVLSFDLSECKELQQPQPIQATLCRKGVFAILKDCPCKVQDLKVSKTGKHGHAKANITGYDIITGKKLVETVPGHTTMFAFEPVKKEYEVADIAEGQITAITAEGEEKVFPLPEGEVGDKLREEFKTNQDKGGDQFFLIGVIYAPRMVGKKWMANVLVESFKAGKDKSASA